MAASLTHIEREPIVGRRLGRRKPDRSRRQIKLADILTGVVPDHPTAADHLSPVVGWTELGNDRWGNCGPVSVANSRRVTTKILTGTDVCPSLNDVLDLYKRSGNPTFDPRTGRGDDGVDMSVMLDAVLDGGIAGVKGIAHATVDVTNEEEVKAATAIFGFLLLGVDLQKAQQTQTDREPVVWEYSRSGDWGGHAVMAGAYTGATSGPDETAISWALKVGLTDSFWNHQVQEAHVLIWPEHLGTHQFQQGIDSNALNSAYMAVTGRAGPFPHTDPVPPPVTPPTGADDALCAAFDVWRATKGL